jgi:hypothetical protein
LIFLSEFIMSEYSNEPSATVSSSNGSPLQRLCCWLSQQFDVIAAECAAEELKALASTQNANESVMRGYKVVVKVTRPGVCPEDVASRRRAIATVLARTLIGS